MAKKLDPRLLEILTTYGERPEDALWDCHGTEHGTQVEVHTSAGWVPAVIIKRKGRLESR